jgi:prepilin-type N-terminal cleavage/methylation domain-containing protein
MTAADRMKIFSTTAPPRRRTRGFSLTELLVVIGIIVVILAMAVPLFNIMTGSRSIEASHNTVSAMLQRARARAMGIQEPRGVLFFNDTVANKVAMVMVRIIDKPISVSSSEPLSYPLELDEVNADAEYLQTGVGVAFHRPTINAQGGRVDPTGGTDINKLLGRPNGLVMFDGHGRLKSVNGQVFWAKPNQLSNGALNTELYKAFFDRWDGQATDATEWSSETIMLYDRKALASLPPATSPLEFSTDQTTWLNQNANLLLVSRYNGTIIKGE